MQQILNNQSFLTNREQTNRQWVYDKGDFCIPKNDAYVITYPYPNSI